jgi:hypothetical protein
MTEVRLFCLAARTDGFADPLEHDFAVEQQKPAAGDEQKIQPRNVKIANPIPLPYTSMSTIFQNHKPARIISPAAPHIISMPICDATKC